MAMLVIQKSLIKILRREGYLLQDVHSHLWRDACLHKFTLEEEIAALVQTTINLGYDWLTKNRRVEAYALQ